MIAISSFPLSHEAIARGPFVEGRLGGQRGGPPRLIPAPMAGASRCNTRGESARDCGSSSGTSRTTRLSPATITNERDTPVAGEGQVVVKVSPPL